MYLEGVTVAEGQIMTKIFIGTFIFTALGLLGQFLEWKEQSKHE